MHPGRRGWDTSLTPGSRWCGTHNTPPLSLTFLLRQDWQPPLVGVVCEQWWWGPVLGGWSEKSNAGIIMMVTTTVREVLLLAMAGPLLRLYAYRAEKAGPSSAEAPAHTPLDSWHLIHMPTAKKRTGPMLAPMVPSLAIVHLSLSSRVLCPSLGADSSDSSQCTTRTSSLDSAFLKRQRWPFFQAEPAARSDLLSRAYTYGLLSSSPLPMLL